MGVPDRQAHGVQRARTGDSNMPRGSSQSYTSKQKRMTSQLEQGSKTQGRSTKPADPIARATGNKRKGGGKQRSGK